MLPSNVWFIGGWTGLFSKFAWTQSANLLCVCAQLFAHYTRLKKLFRRSNHPGKLAKIGSELEKRLKLECKKAKSGNIRSRAWVKDKLLITKLLIFYQVLSSFHYPSFAHSHQNAEETWPFSPRLSLDLWNSLLRLCQPILRLLQEGPVLCVPFFNLLIHLWFLLVYGVDNLYEWAFNWCWQLYDDGLPFHPSAICIIELF